MRKLLFLFAAGLLTMTSCKKPEVNVYIDGEEVEIRQDALVSLGTMRGISASDVTGKSYQVASKVVSPTEFEHKVFEGPYQFSIINQTDTSADRIIVADQTIDVDGNITTVATARVVEGDDYKVSFTTVDSRTGNSWESFHFGTNGAQSVPTATASNSWEIPVEPKQGLLTFDWNLSNGLSVNISVRRSGSDVTLFPSEAGGDNDYAYILPGELVVGADVIDADGTTILNSYSLLIPAADFGKGDHQHVVINYDGENASLTTNWGGNWGDPNTNTVGN